MIFISDIQNHVNQTLSASMADVKKNVLRVALTKFSLQEAGPVLSMNSAQLLALLADDIDHELVALTNEFENWMRSKDMNTGLSLSAAAELIEECERDLEMAKLCAIELQSTIQIGQQPQSNYVVLINDVKALLKEETASYLIESAIHGEELKEYDNH